MPLHRFFRISAILLAVMISLATEGADTFKTIVKPFISNHCVKCHGGEKVKGKINLKEISAHEELMENPELIRDLIGVLDAGDMPPEDELQPDPKERDALLATLKTLLQSATRGKRSKYNSPQRLNRFQYNNTVRDLFALNRNVFALPEKLMTRETIYLNGPKVPESVKVRSLAMNPAEGLKDVKPFPQDLRASHGFDNQANQLTLSPLLLDAFLRLSVSIVESPDFNENTVGIWNAFFKAPDNEVDIQTETQKRIKTFLSTAFRGPVEPAVLDRYTVYALDKIENKLPYTEAMKKVASAALSSPLFLYRHSSGDKNLNLASNLSYFLWASTPDEALLNLAKSGDLIKPEILNKSIQRMLTDPKIERFLDAFPAQWMQLQNILAATPDPKKHRFFTLDKNHPASLQMVCEPLLLFDAVFVENRPIIELIKPNFSYQSDFLKDWYTTELKAPKLDISTLVKENRELEERKQGLETLIKTTEADLAKLIDPIRQKILEERKKKINDLKPVDLKPYAAWEFDGNLRSSVGNFPLKANGKVSFKDGMAVINRSFLQSSNLPIDLKAKTLEVWCMIPNVDQVGGGVMGTQGPGDFFDTIVLGERKRRHWISGSNGFSRTLDFPESTPETAINQLIHLVMVYQEDGTTLLYRNGTPYGKPFKRSRATFPKDRTSVIFGLRHLPPGGNKYLNVTIDKARLYNRALTAKEVVASASGKNLFVSETDTLKAMTDQQKKEMVAMKETLSQANEAHKKLPKKNDIGKIQQAHRQRFDNDISKKLRSPSFSRLSIKDPRYGGIITNAAMLSMNNGTKRTHPIARGAWIIEVIFNNPPPPPPNDIPPLNEDDGPKNLTIREKFAKHRENPDCAGCHSKLDPLGFALENFDITGRWRDKYNNGRKVDASGTLLRKYEFSDIVKFKDSLVQEDKRFAKAFTSHLLRYALARELLPQDTLTVESIVNDTQKDDYRLKSLIQKVILSDAFLQTQ